MKCVFEIITTMNQDRKHAHRVPPDTTRNNKVQWYARSVLLEKNSVEAWDHETVLIVQKLASAYLYGA